eukprot:scaffold142906_cov17-Prasinocladus_malaysianus.AAC.1
MLPLRMATAMIATNKTMLEVKTIVIIVEAAICIFAVVTTDNIIPSIYSSSLSYLLVMPSQLL